MSDEDVVVTEHIATFQVDVLEIYFRLFQCSLMYLPMYLKIRMDLLERVKEIKAGGAKQKRKTKKTKKRLGKCKRTRKRKIKGGFKQHLFMLALLFIFMTFISSHSTPESGDRDIVVEKRSQPFLTTLAEYEDFKADFKSNHGGELSYLYNSNPYIQIIGGTCNAIAAYIAGFENKQMFMQRTNQQIQHKVSEEYTHYEFRQVEWAKLQNVTLNMKSWGRINKISLNKKELIAIITREVAKVLTNQQNIIIGSTSTFVISIWYKRNERESGHAVTCFATKTDAKIYSLEILDSNDSTEQFKTLEDWIMQENFYADTFSNKINVVYSDTVFDNSYNYESFIGFNKELLGSFTKSPQLTTHIMDYLRDEINFFQNMLFYRQEPIAQYYPRFRYNNMDSVLGKNPNGLLPMKQRFVEGCDNRAIDIERQTILSFFPQLPPDDLILQRHVQSRCRYGETLQDFVYYAFNNTDDISSDTSSILKKQKQLLAKRSKKGTLTVFDCEIDDVKCNPTYEMLMTDETKENKKKLEKLIEQEKKEEDDFRLATIHDRSERRLKKMREMLENSKSMGKSLEEDENRIKQEGETIRTLLEKMKLKEVEARKEEELKKSLQSKLSTHLENDTLYKYNEMRQTFEKMRKEQKAEENRLKQEEENKLKEEKANEARMKILKERLNALILEEKIQKDEIMLKQMKDKVFKLKKQEKEK